MPNLGSQTWYPGFFNIILLKITQSRRLKFCVIFLILKPTPYPFLYGELIVPPIFGQQLNHEDLTPPPSLTSFDPFCPADFHERFLPNILIRACPIFRKIFPLSFITLNPAYRVSNFTRTQGRRQERLRIYATKIQCRVRVCNSVALLKIGSQTHSNSAIMVRFYQRGHQSNERSYLISFSSLIVIGILAA